MQELDSSEALNEPDWQTVQLVAAGEEAVPAVQDEQSPLPPEEENLPAGHSMHLTATVVL